MKYEDIRSRIDLEEVLHMEEEAEKDKYGNYRFEFYPNIIFSNLLRLIAMFYIYIIIYDYVTQEGIFKDSIGLVLVVILVAGTFATGIKKFFDGLFKETIIFKEDYMVIKKLGKNKLFYSDLKSKKLIIVAGRSITIKDLDGKDYKFINRNNDEKLGFFAAILETKLNKPIYGNFTGQVDKWDEKKASDYGLIIDFPGIKGVVKNGAQQSIVISLVSIIPASIIMLKLIINQVEISLLIIIGLIYIGFLYQLIKSLVTLIDYKKSPFVKEISFIYPDKDLDSLVDDIDMDLYKADNYESLVIGDQWMFAGDHLLNLEDMYELKIKYEINEKINNEYNGIYIFMDFKMDKMDDKKISLYIKNMFILDRFILTMNKFKNKNKDIKIKLNGKKESIDEYFGEKGKEVEDLFNRLNELDG